MPGAAQSILNYLAGVSETCSQLDVNYVPRPAGETAAATAPAPAVLSQSGPPPQLPAQGGDEPEAGEVPAGPVTLPADSGASLVPTDGDFDSLIIGGGDDADDEGAAAAAAVERPLTAAERKTRAKKQATVRRDEEEILKIGANREMKLKEILEDAEQVKAIVARERPTVTRDSLLRSQTRSFKHILNLMYLRQNEAKTLQRQSTKRGACCVSCGASCRSLTCAWQDARQTPQRCSRRRRRLRGAVDRQAVGPASARRQAAVRAGPSRRHHRRRRRAKRRRPRRAANAAGRTRSRCPSSLCRPRPALR